MSGTAWHQHRLTAPLLLLQWHTGQRLEEPASLRWTPALEALYDTLTHPFAWMRPTAQEAIQKLQAHLDQLLAPAPLVPDAAMEVEADSNAARMVASLFS